jgi:hypothetical protein
MKKLNIMHVAFKYLLSIGLVLYGNTLFSQSDLCSSAPSISIGEDCVTQAFDMSGFSNESGALYSDSPNRDGWYSITTGSDDIALKITAINNVNHQMALALYEACGDSLPIAFVIPRAKEAILYANVEPNTTYMLRVMRMTSTTPNTLGTICVQSIKAVVAYAGAGHMPTSLSLSEPTTSSTSSCAATLSLNIPTGNAITTVSTFYQMRGASGGFMSHQRSMLSSTTLGTNEGTIYFGSGDVSNLFKYSRENLTFAEGAMGTVDFQLNAWRTSVGSGCNTDYNYVVEHSWAVVAYYTPASSCPSPSLSSIHTLAQTTTTATISWTAPDTEPDSGYEYYYSTSNAMPSGTGTAVAGNTVSLNSLSAGTQYYFFVRGVCAEEEYGVWNGPYEFSTDVCSSVEQCYYQLHMNNSTPYGWNGTVLGFKQDGILIATAQLENGNSGIVGIPLCDGKATEVYVHQLGSYSEEISFTLYDAFGNIETMRNFGSPLSANQLLDSFMSTCPDCHAPVNITVTYPGSDIVYIEWQAPSATPGDGYEYVISTNDAFPSGDGTPVMSGTSVSVDGLLSSTVYYAFVRSACSSSLKSAWAGPVSITTSCSPSTLTVHEGLNSASPVCWEIEVVHDGTNMGGTAPELSYVTTSSNPSGLTAYEGSGFLKFNSYNCDGGDKIRLISTPFETTGLNGVDVNFKWNHDANFASNNDGVQVQYSFDKIHWTNAGSVISRFSASISGWYPHSVTLPESVLDQSHVYVSFLFVSGAGNDCYIDDILLRETPACQMPTAVKAVSMNDASTRIEWNAPASTPAGGYNWELRTSGAAGSGASGLVASGNSSDTYVDIESLTSLASYTFYVRADCGGEQSDWTWKYQFRTVAPVVDEFPFIETFETNSTSRAAWQNEFHYGNLNWVYATGAGSGDVTTAHTGDLNARFRTTADIAYKTMLVSPPLNLEPLNAGARLKFWYANQSWSSRQNELRVYYKTSYSAEWQLIPGAVYATNQNTWQEVVIILPETGSDYYIAFEGLNKNSRGIAVDDILIEPIECPIPTASAVAGMTSAFISWEIDGYASTKQFQWELRTSGQPGSGATGLKSSSTTALEVLGRNITNLTASTTYHLYVRTICGQDDISLWSEVYTFTTSNIPPPNNDQFTSARVVNHPNNVYPNCYIYEGTTIGATPFMNIAHNDVWYKFNAVTNGVSIKLTQNSFDAVIILTDANRNILNIENITGANQREVLNYDQLIPGETYYFAIANYLPLGTPDGNFKFCISNVRPSYVSSSNMNLCEPLRAYNVGASQYVFTFTPTGNTQGGVRTITTNNFILSSLGLPQLNMNWGDTYMVSVDAIYHIPDGLGQNETIIINGIVSNEIAITDAPVYKLSPNFTCTQRTMTLSLYISPSKASSNNLCTISKFHIEFTRVDDCEGNNPNEATTFVVPTSSASTSLAYAFSVGGITTQQQAAGYWRVRYRPIIPNTPTVFGPEVIMAMLGATPPSANLQVQEDDVNSEFQALENQFHTSIYPNPNNGDYVNIQIQSGQSLLCNVRILDTSGRVIHSTQHTVEGQYATQIYFAEKLPAGLYFVEYQMGDIIKIDKLLIIH